MMRKALFTAIFCIIMVSLSLLTAVATPKITFSNTYQPTGMPFQIAYDVIQSSDKGYVLEALAEVQNQAPLMLTW